MCGRYYVNDETAREIEKVVRQVNEKLLHERRDVYPQAKASVIVGGENLAVAEYTWGFPPFIGQPKSKVIFNARAESVLTKRMFQDSARKRRLVVPASGFYEWDENKDRYFFKSKDDKILLFAGIYRDDRFVILTTDANDSVKDIHHRMPLILEPPEIDDWIFDDGATEQILRKKPRQLDKEIDGQMSLFDKSRS
jgi:putative SOS response-associated peptidase YedK